MKEKAKHESDPFILSQRDRKSGKAVSLGRNFLWLFLLSGYWLCPGKPPASRKTYWISDNLGMNRASTEGVDERVEGGKQCLHGLLPQFTFPSTFCSFTHSSYSPVGKSMTGLMLHMSTYLTFIVPSKLYLSSCAAVRVWLVTALMPPVRDPFYYSAEDIGGI